MKRHNQNKLMKKNIGFIILLLLTTIGCSSKKNITTEKATQEEITSRTEQILKEGYIEALVEDKTKEGCNFVLKNTKTDNYLLPIKLEDRFKVDGTKVWLKYRPIRPIQNGCSFGTPITIEEIKRIE